MTTHNKGFFSKIKYPKCRAAEAKPCRIFCPPIRVRQALPHLPRNLNSGILLCEVP
ncbi:Uncharacterized protein dnm_028320 [Desulfonema magnum]|uniref:Uncharacterized protein n=1 Tax=Desulfonema magnum TaxID=45655 RepID=A0A975BKI5_9BACT|nr:Uncharacterized protein dnm_028320 [Desulfonema magnum]